jgi:hypothetical protein
MRIVPIASAAGPSPATYPAAVRRHHHTKRKPLSDIPFRLTYATMFDPPAELHAHFDAALTEVRSNLGFEHAMLIGGEDVRANGQFDSRAPADTDLLLGRFQEGSPDESGPALAAEYEDILGTINDELRHKIQSGRLGPIRWQLSSPSELASRFGGDRHAGRWEAQFKFLPLLQQRWDD